MYQKRIQISWKRMLELLKTESRDVSEIKSDRELFDFFAGGRHSDSCSKFSLSTQEVIELDNLGITWERDNIVCLVAEKEVFPGKYFVGEF